MTTPEPEPLDAPPVRRDLPADVIRVHAERISIMLAPVDGGGINLGLLVEAPPPLGAIRISLDAEQAEHLCKALHEIGSLTPAQVATVTAQIHTPNTD